MLFFLIAGHMLMDFALQGDAMASCKCRDSGRPLQKVVPWYYWLTAHCFLHGATVGVVVHWFGYTMEVATWFAAIETVVHWFIDWGKCEGRYNIHVDQGLHVGCKFLWWAVLAFTPAAAFLSSIPLPFPASP